MDNLIKLLPDHVANQIAAGEVVQRPSSVVKELLENSIDSGAKKISLLIKESGRTLIQVVDNGCGMSKSFIHNRLFKAFDTTKGNAGMGIGVFEAKQFIEGIAGILKVESIEGEGTTFIIDLPINPVYA